MMMAPATQTNNLPKYGFRPEGLWLPKASAMEFFTATLPETARSLGSAIVRSSSTPLLLLDDQLVVLAISDTFCSTFGLHADAVLGTDMFLLGAGEWDILQLRSLLMATLSGDAAIDAYELVLRRPTGDLHLVLNARRLDYAGDETRLILSVTDVTAVRLSEQQKSDLVREKMVLLQELQHRVANSLQIIASVLMQSARRVQSDEARTHLNNTHHRVMPVFANGIAYSASETDDSNSFNECLTVHTDDQMLYLRGMGMAHYGGNRESKLSQEGAAELFWAMLVESLQHR
jgi:two-component system, sensor histidine kinase PdtaS